MTSEALNPQQPLDHLHALAAEALRAWQLSGAELSLIKYRENAVFRVQMPSGTRYALRIHRSGYHSEQALHSELQWVDSLITAGIEAPRPIPTPTGELLVKTTWNGDARYVDLFAWIEGEQLGNVETGCVPSAESVNATYTTIGRIAARLHNHTSSWTPPADFERHAWDADGLVGDSPFWGRFWELPTLTGEQFNLIVRARDALRRDLLAYGQSATRYSMIHADFVPENLLVDGDHVRLIDFDDAGFGWHMFEIATVLYFIQEEPFYSDAKAALLTGYQEFRPLTQQDLDTLPLFLAARGFTYLGWVQSRWETETAREMTPQLVVMACESATRYLQLAPVVSAGTDTSSTAK